MGSSFVEYKGFGFWTPDSFLESWIRSLFDEMAKLPVPEEWQQSLIKDWQVQVAMDGGCMSLHLDHFLANDVRKDFMLSTAKAALKHAPPLGHRTGELFIALLSGKLKTTASSPIDYLEDAR